MYEIFYRKILYPFYESFLRGRKTLEYLNELEKHQWLSEEKLRDIQWNKLQKLLKHAYENVPYYREKFQKEKLRPSDIKNLEDLVKIPVLTKDDIRNKKEKLIAQNYKKNEIFGNVTGGSTGSPLKFFMDHNNYEWRQAAVRRVYGWANCRDGAKTALIWGAPVYKEPMLAKIKNNLDTALKRHKIFNTFFFNEETMDRCIDEINRFKPKVIIAYTSPLFNFAKFIKKKKKIIHQPKSIITAAEKLYPSQRKVIEEVFQSPLFETYGCREVSSIAGECERHNGMHINMERIFLETVKDNLPVQTGETGELVITDLTNYGMPFIRYKNGDLCSLSKEKCSCGRGLTLINNIEGRTLDTVKTSDGRFIPGEFFIYWFMQFEEIIRFQIIQEDINSLVVKMVAERKASKERLDILKNVIYKIMGEKISIDFQFVDNIALTRSGKFRVVVSKVPINF